MFSVEVALFSVAVRYSKHPVSIVHADDLVQPKHQFISTYDADQQLITPARVFSH